jgi:hypothetical protein
MKSQASIVLGASLVFALAAPLMAQSGASANGNFQFALTGASGAIQFDARAHAGGARGTVTFTSTQDAPNTNSDEENAPSNPLSGVSMEVAVDCLRVSGNRAAMSGIISSSSAPGFVGLRAILAVEDGGEGVKAAQPDRFTWGAYHSTSRNWTPEDAEVPGDNGATFTWYATDAERNDDVPVLVNGGENPQSIDCKSFALGSYAFEALAHGAGNIQVRP